MSDFTGAPNDCMFSVEYSFFLDGRSIHVQFSKAK